MGKSTTTSSFIMIIITPSASQGSSLSQLARLKGPNPDGRLFQSQHEPCSLTALRRFSSSSIVTFLLSWPSLSSVRSSGDNITSSGFSFLRLSIVKFHALPGDSVTRSNSGQLRARKRFSLFRFVLSEASGSLGYSAYYIVPSVPAAENVTERRPRVVAADPIRAAFFKFAAPSFLGVLWSLGLAIGCCTMFLRRENVYITYVVGRWCLLFLPFGFISLCLFFACDV